MGKPACISASLHSVLLSRYNACVNKKPVAFAIVSLARQEGTLIVLTSAQEAVVQAENYRAGDAAESVSLINFYHSTKLFRLSDLVFLNTSHTNCHPINTN